MVGIHGAVGEEVNAEKSVLSNGKYTVSVSAMAKHTSGAAADIAFGKSQFFYRANAEHLVLQAAEYADANNLWVGNKAKVYFSQPIGVLSNGTPTNYVNVYRKASGFIHGTPGTPR